MVQLCALETKLTKDLLIKQRTLIHNKLIISIIIILYITSDIDNYLIY